MGARVAMLVRHCESGKNRGHMLSRDPHDVYPLTADGISGALDVGKELDFALERGPAEGPWLLNASPVLRAIDTASWAGIPLHDFTIIREPRLAERDFGRYEGRAFPDYEAVKLFELGEILRGYPEGGIESWASMQERGMGFLQGADYSQGPVIAFTHIDPIRPIVGFFNGMGEEEMLRWDSRIPYGSFTIIDMDREGPGAVLAFGSRAIPDKLYPLLRP